MKIKLLFLLLVFNMACSNTKKMQKTSTGIAKETYVQEAFDKEGHRGCRGLMPENTIPAMIICQAVPTEPETEAGLRFA